MNENLALASEPRCYNSRPVDQTSVSFSFARRDTEIAAARVLAPLVPGRADLIELSD
jgi:hypothetical protein